MENDQAMNAANLRKYGWIPVALVAVVALLVIVSRGLSRSGVPAAEEGKPVAGVEDGKSRAAQPGPAAKKRPKRPPSVTEDQRYIAFVKSLEDPEYPRDPTARKAVLISQLETLLKFPDGSRETLISLLQDSYAKNCLASGTPEEKVANLLIFSQALKACDPAGKNALVSSGAEHFPHTAATVIEASQDPGTDALKQYLKSMPKDPDNPVPTRILGEISAYEILDKEHWDPAELTAIQDPVQRQAAEAALMEGADLEEAGQPAKLARFYLSDQSSIKSNDFVESTLFGDGMESHAEEIAQVLSEATPGAKRDRATMQLIRTIAARDPEIALEWSNMIQNPAARTQAQRYIQNKSAPKKK